MKKIKKLSRDQSEEAVAKYWETHGVDDLDWSKAEHWVFPNLKLTSKPITIRLQESLLARVKERANRLDMPYQTLIKQFIFKGMGMI